MDDEKFEEMLWSVGLGAVILFFVMLPQFCFKVDKKEFEKYKIEDMKRQQKEYVAKLKKKLKEEREMNGIKPKKSKSDIDAKDSNSKATADNSEGIISEDDAKKLD